MWDFASPIIAAYLAGTSLASSGGSLSLINQPSWMGKNITLGYLAYWNDITSLIAPKLEASDDPLMRDFLTACRWLRDATKSSQWRPLVMRKMASIMQKHRLPLGLRARTLAALLYSGDPGVPVLLRQLLANTHGSVRMLSAIGCGVLKDTKAVEILFSLIDDVDIRVSQAALLALVAIGNKPALDAVASTLLEGDERQRRAAALSAIASTSCLRAPLRIFPRLFKTGRCSALAEVGPDRTSFSCRTSITPSKFAPGLTGTVIGDWSTAELLAAGLQSVLERCTFLGESIYEEETRKVQLFDPRPQPCQLRPHPHVAAQNKDNRIDGLQCGEWFTKKIECPGGVNQIDVGVIPRELKETGTGRIAMTKLFRLKIRKQNNPFPENAFGKKH